MVASFFAGTLLSATNLRDLAGWLTGFGARVSADYGVIVCVCMELAEISRGCIDVHVCSGMV